MSVIAERFGSPFDDLPNLLSISAIGDFDQLGLDSSEGLNSL